MKRSRASSGASERHGRVPCRTSIRRDDSVSGPEWVDRWALSMQAAGCSSRTISERTNLVRKIAALNGREAHRLTENDVERHLAAVPAQSSRATYWGYLQTWHSWLIEREVRGDDPMRHVARPREPRRRPRPISTEQLEVLLSSRMQRRTRTMVLLAAYAGLRVHEIAKIRGEDVDTLSSTLTVCGKGGVTEVLPLHPVLAQAAALHPRVGFWFPTYENPDSPVMATSVSRTVSSAMARAGVDATAHQLRHWYATELLRSGSDVRTVQTLMRHASLATTAQYTEVADGRRAEGICRLPVPTGTGGRI